MSAALALAATADPLHDLHGLASRPVLLFFTIAALSLAPFLVLLMTSFVKIVLVLSLLRSALGSAQIPPAQIVTGLALVLTLYIMAPTGERMVAAARADVSAGAGAELVSGRGVEAIAVAATKAKEPLREFLLKHASAKDRSLYQALALRLRGPRAKAAPGDADFVVLVPAFLTCELRRAFEIGFLLLIPFLVVDLVVAMLLASLGMHALSPTSVSLPFKLLLFVLADGWQLLLRGLVESYV